MSPFLEKVYLGKQYDDETPRSNLIREETKKKVHFTEVYKIKPIIVGRFFYRICTSM